MISAYAALLFWRRVFEQRMMYGIMPNNPLRLRTIAVAALHVDPVKGAPWMVLAIDEKKGVRLSDIQELSNTLRWTITITAEIAVRAVSIDDALRSADAMAEAIIDIVHTTLSSPVVIEERRNATNAITSVVLAELFEARMNALVTYWTRGADKEWLSGAKVSFDHTMVEVPYAAL